MVAVLVLDAAQRSALSVTRSLGDHCKVIVADEAELTLGGASKYVFTSEVYASPSSASEFIADINRIIEKYNIQVLYPTTEITVYTLLENKHLLRSVKLPFSDIGTVKKLADKASLIELSRSLGVQAPASDYYDNAGSLQALSKEYQYPVVVKPTLSRVKLDEGWLNTAVTYAHSQSELNTIVTENVAFSDHPFMIQEYIDGHGSGVFLLYDHGQCIAHFAHKRLREKPPTGGVSVLSESVVAEPKQLEAAKKLLDAVQWHGVAMVEFKVNSKGEPYIIEVNPRFWGSLQLAVDSGVDFPLLLHKATMGEDLAPASSYRVGQKLRWLLGDFDRLYLVLKGKEYSVSQKFAELMRFLVPYLPSMRYEVNRRSDMKPFWAELKLYIKALRR